MNLRFDSSDGPSGRLTPAERIKLRLAMLGVLILVVFIALFSRLWFLQVLASEDFRQAARENRIRKVYSEPPRGRILDRNGVVLVDNRSSKAITVNRQVIDEPTERRRLLRKLTTLLVEKACLPRPAERQRPTKELRKERRQTLNSLKDHLADITVSPYKPVAVAYDVPLEAAQCITDNHEDFPGVAIDRVPVRTYPQGKIAAQILGYVAEIGPDDLALDYFNNAHPAYQEGDVVGKAGVERVYDRVLRGSPRIERVAVNSRSEVLGKDLVQEERPGKDLVLTIDARIQRIAEQALENGIMAARGSYEAPDGAVAVMDPNTGEVIAMASFPSYNPATLADGITNKEWRALGVGSDDLTDDALSNRAIQAAVPPGSTFKVVTAGAAIANGLADPTELIDCNPSFEYRTSIFNNWTSLDMGPMDLSTALEVSCDTYFYVLGSRLEEAFGPENSAGGDGTERFQKYMRLAGFGHETGIDLPSETSGRVPDEEWCDEFRELTDGEGCALGWLPGMTVNMSIGQGDLIVSPIQMAVTFAAIANGGNVVEPHVAKQIGRPDPDTGDLQVLKEMRTRVVNELPLDATTLSEMHEGLQAVVSGGNGTANSAFAGFPVDSYPVAGKTGTAQIGSLDSGKNFAWFISYAPADAPQYVVSVYIEKAGHGGESAAPVAREIFEGIFELDDELDVQLGSDESG